MAGKYYVDISTLLSIFITADRDAGGNSATDAYARPLGTMHNKPQVLISDGYAFNYLKHHHLQNFHQNAALQRVVRLTNRPSYSNNHTLLHCRHLNADNMPTMTLRHSSEGCSDTFLGPSQHFGWLLDTKIIGGACFMAIESTFFRQLYRSYVFLKNSIYGLSTVPNNRFAGMPVVLYADILSIITNFITPGTESRMKMTGTPQSLTRWAQCTTSPRCLFRTDTLLTT